MFSVAKQINRGGCLVCPGGAAHMKGIGCNLLRALWWLTKDVLMEKAVSFGGGGGGGLCQFSIAIIMGKVKRQGDAGSCGGT